MSRIPKIEKERSRSCLVLHAPCAMRCALCALIFALFGCGYQFRPTGEPIGTTLDSLAVPLMASTSAEPGFEATFTKVIRDEFISHARVPLLPTEEARFTLVGRIHDIYADPQSYAFQEVIVQGEKIVNYQTNRRRLRLRLDVSLVERATGKVVWKEDGMETRASYEVTTDPLVNQQNKMLALERIAKRLAQRIYMRTMERF